MRPSRAAGIVVLLLLLLGVAPAQAQLDGISFSLTIDTPQDRYLTDSSTVKFSVEASGVSNTSAFLVIRNPDDKIVFRTYVLIAFTKGIAEWRVPDVPSGLYVAELIHSFDDAARPRITFEVVNQDAIAYGIVTATGTMESATQRLNGLMATASSLLATTVGAFFVLVVLRFVLPRGLTRFVKQKEKKLRQAYKPVVRFLIKSLKVKAIFPLVLIALIVSPASAAPVSPVAWDLRVGVVEPLLVNETFSVWAIGPEGESATFEVLNNTKSVANESFVMPEKSTFLWRVSLNATGEYVVRLTTTNVTFKQSIEVVENPWLLYLDLFQLKNDQNRRLLEEASAFVGQVQIYGLVGAGIVLVVLLIQRRKPKSPSTNKEIRRVQRRIMEVVDDR